MEAQLMQSNSQSVFTIRKDDWWHCCCVLASSTVFVAAIMFWARFVILFVVPQPLSNMLSQYIHTTLTSSSLSLSLARVVIAFIFLTTCAPEDSSVELASRSSIWTCLCLLRLSCHRLHRKRRHRSEEEYGLPLFHSDLDDFETVPQSLLLLHQMVHLC